MRCTWQISISSTSSHKRDPGVVDIQDQRQFDRPSERGLILRQEEHPNSLLLVDKICSLTTRSVVLSDVRVGAVEQVAVWGEPVIMEDLA